MGPWKPSIFNLDNKQVNDMTQNAGRMIPSSMAEKMCAAKGGNLYLFTFNLYLITFSQKVKYMQ